MAGQVKHVQIFSSALPDLRMVKMLWNLERRNTGALIGGVADELAITSLDNAASEKLLTKLGFTFDETTDFNGESLKLFVNG